MSQSPSNASESLPGVTYVMPVLNDVTHVRAAVDSLLAQDYAGAWEVAIAVGPSIDGTNELVAALAATDSRITVLNNAAGTTPAGLNLAISSTTFPIVVRVDAHSVLPTDYTRIAVETIQRTNAANVGGIMDAQGTTAFESAVARAYGSRVGLGGGAHHVGGQEGPAETVYLGVFQREPLERVGMFDERIKRGQDWELNHRLRREGETVWFTPELRVVYRPRPSLKALARQFFSTGMWRGELSRSFPSRSDVRYFAPPVMVLAVVLGLVSGILGLCTLGLTGVATWPLWGLLIPAGYLVIVIAAMLAIGLKDGPRSALWFLIVIPCIHFYWGVGFILGYLSLAQGIATLTYKGGSRARTQR